MNQTIVVAGINHFDPLGREKIIKLLDTLKINKNFIPDCIAVEWDETFATIIRNQRDDFFKLAKRTQFRVIELYTSCFS